MSRQSHRTTTRVSVAKEALYLGLLTVGVAVPYAQAPPWLRRLRARR